MSLLGRSKRRPVDPGRLFEVTAPPAGGDLPLLVSASVPGTRLAEWAARHKSEIETWCLSHGAVLLRGFSDGGMDGLKEFVRTVCGEPAAYQFRASPRTEVADRIYTSTDYPADMEIFPHNEGAYARHVPVRIVFRCKTPARHGGQTPLGSNRRISEAIPRHVKDRFLRHGVMYVRNYLPGFGLPWQTVFQTMDRAQVNLYCAEAGMQVEWVSEEHVRTRQCGPAMIRHPLTGERVWFNHATFFHVSTLPDEVTRGLQLDLEEHSLPNNTYYGDGSPIEPDTLETLGGIYRDNLVDCDWRSGDVLVLDNILAVHGRRPYAGERSIHVAMARIVDIHQHAVGGVGK
jgi:alpha-ketoglutarate-dependent taurine dioxygenase